MKQAALFDLDGTLWDACEVVTASWNRTIAASPLRGRVLTLAEVRGVMGLQLQPIAERFFPDVEETLRIRVMQQCCEEECAALREQGGQLFEGVPETLRQLAEGRFLAVVSNCQCGYIEAFLQAHGLGDCFRDTICEGDTGRSKADNIRLLMERNGLTDAVYVGDTEGDEAAARQAGVPFIHAAYGFGTAAKPCAVLRNFCGLPALLETL